MAGSGEPQQPWKMFGKPTESGFKDGSYLSRPLSRAEEVADTYMPAPELVNAVKIALYLAKPLLLSGDPGTGKTSVAYSVAAQLGLGPVLKFSARASSAATDVLYSYDSIRHFSASHSRSDTESAPVISEYIKLDALGTAIVRADKDNFNSEIDCMLPADKSGKPRRCVVLIDEIDKAPRDFPNDLLNEIDRAEFKIPELRESFIASAQLKPIVFITTNDEKDLPAAFLRRCVFQQLKFPDDVVLKEIVRRRLKWEMQNDKDNPALFLEDKLINEAITLIRGLHKKDLQRKPGTSELLDILLAAEGMLRDGQKLGSIEQVPCVLGLLAKTDADAQRIKP